MLGKICDRTRSDPSTLLAIADCQTANAGNQSARRTRTHPSRRPSYLCPSANPSKAKSDLRRILRSPKPHKPTVGIHLIVRNSGSRRLWTSYFENFKGNYHTRTFILRDRRVCWAGAGSCLNRLKIVGWRGHRRRTYSHN